ncbi:hypothetical protein H5410_018951 [Solanum commersonii]|uniref:Uncharacterized protein n=1 Tax=Solanum commersonii TaxID=4109 RepID=A0A9J6A4V7_SOLCO|nr:hypothetical protein H5410_018951 [Solanum commersonii]
MNGDSDNECFHFPKHNPKIEAKHLILALEYTFGSKEEFKNAVSIHELKAGKSNRVGFSGSSLKCAFSATASSTTVKFFNARINDIVKLDAKIIVCMMLDARDKPIIILLEKLRYLLMARLQANKADRWNSDDVYARIWTKMKKILLVLFLKGRMNGTLKFLTEV